MIPVAETRRLLGAPFAGFPTKLAVFFARVSFGKVAGGARFLSHVHPGRPLVARMLAHGPAVGRGFEITE